MDSEVRFVAAVPALPVADIDSAARFWQERFGFERLQQADVPQDLVVRDAVEVHFWVPDGVHKGAELHLIGSASCRIEVVGVDALYERCLSAGVVHPAAKLRETTWGTREFSVLDPSGNLVSVYERVSA